MSIASMIGLDGASKPQPPAPVVKRDPREIHPAAVEAAVKWSQMWDTNDQLVAENTQLRNEVEILERVGREKDELIANLRDVLTENQRNTDQRIEIMETHLRAEVGRIERETSEKLNRAEREKEKYLRYAVDLAGRLRGCGEQINSSLRSCAEQITAAHHAAMEMARAEEQLPKAPTLEPHDDEAK